ncbi:uncharacterized protein LOC136002827, partial [Caloenas nicobarica]|uniref:uncharacterized protein LOC136002827 n=1 Tax=Caloenas nicobarica TaxID=187106 RepID=UPI0032B7D706
MAAGGGVGVIGVIAALTAALPHSGAFNIHPAPYRVLTHSGSSSFGHQVLQLEGDRLLVGAPVGSGGRLFQCRVEPGECQELELDATSTSTHVGMALGHWGRDVIVSPAQCPQFIPVPSSSSQSLPVPPSSSQSLPVPSQSLPVPSQSPPVHPSPSQFLPVPPSSLPVPPSSLPVPPSSLPVPSQFLPVPSQFPPSPS